MTEQDLFARSVITMSNTNIEWTDKVWNPITGCDPISVGCDNCYARRMAHRLAGRCGYPKDNPFAVTFHPERLVLPLRWKKPCRIFVNSMGDLFHDAVRYEWLERVFSVIDRSPKHTFQILTKRPEKMRLAFSRIQGSLFKHAPYPNVWVGVTVESSKHKDRIDILRTIPAAMRFISFEPLLDDVGELDLTGIGWLIVGGETGQGAREMRHEWATKIKDQCVDAHVPFFYKGMGTYELSKKAAGTEYRRLDGRWWPQFPED
jgi:protein gp37